MARRVDVKVRLDSNIDEEIKKDSGAVKGLSRDIDKLSKDGTRSLSLLSKIGIAGLTAGLFKLGQEAIQLTDKYSLMSSQIKLVIDDVENLEDVQSQLLVTSNKTRQSVQQTTELYTKLDRATRELGLSDTDVIGLTETLNKAFIISGSSAEESANGVRQLTQAIQGGVLRAEEYNSIIEQTPRIAEMFATSLNKTQGEFRKLVIEGKVTTKQLIDAIEGQREAINEEFGKIEETSGQVWTVLKNNAESYISSLDLVKKAQGLFNDVLKDTSEGFEQLSKINALETAKSVSLLDRSSEQQKLIIEDLKDQQIRANEAVTASQTRAIRERNQITRDAIQQAKARAEENLKFIEKNEDRELERLKKVKQEQAKLKKQKEEELEAEKELAIYKDAESKRAIDAQLTLIGIEKEQEEIRKQRVIDRIEDRKTERALIDEYREQDELIALEGYERSKAIIEQRKQDEIDLVTETLSNRQELAEALLIIDKKYNAESLKLDKLTTQQKIKNSLSTASIVVGALRDVFGENKAFASADIIINTARGIQRSFADVPFPFNGIQAAAIGASGIAQLAKVNGAKFADGTEFVSGSGGSRTDSVPSLLSRGERVVDANTNARLNGVSNDELVEGNRDNFSILGMVNALFSPEEIAQRLTDYRGLSDLRGFVPQG